MGPEKSKYQVPADRKVLDLSYKQQEGKYSGEEENSAAEPGRGLVKVRC